MSVGNGKSVSAGLSTAVVNCEYSLTVELILGVACSHMAGSGLDCAACNGGVNVKYGIVSNLNEGAVGINLSLVTVKVEADGLSSSLHGSKLFLGIIVIKGYCVNVVKVLVHESGSSVNLNVSKENDGLAALKRCVCAVELAFVNTCGYVAFSILYVVGHCVRLAEDRNVVNRIHIRLSLGKRMELESFRVKSPT